MAAWAPRRGQKREQLGEDVCSCFSSSQPALAGAIHVTWKKLIQQMRFSTTTITLNEANNKNNGNNSNNVTTTATTTTATML